MHGVGGIGKTALVQVALLLERLTGKEVISIAAGESYATGSGYTLFREKCKDAMHPIIGEEITLDDIIDSLPIKEQVAEEMKKQGKTDKIDSISKWIRQNEAVVFLDDFHLADDEVRELVPKTEGMIVPSKKYSGATKNDIPVFGIREDKREKLIDMLAYDDIPKEAKEKIKEVIEGHPVSTQILVRNYQRIDFSNLKKFKEGFDLSKDQHVEEFLKRAVKGILSEDEFNLLKDLAILNTEAVTNIHRDAVECTQDIPDVCDTFNALVDGGFLRKKEDQERIYRFTYRHIKQVIREDAKDRHRWALKYYIACCSLRF